MEKKISEGQKSDISTVIAYYTPEYYDSLPDPGNGPYGKIEKRKCDSWSCFWGHYNRGEEREFIKSIDCDKYEWFRISWSNCN